MYFNSLFNSIVLLYLILIFIIFFLVNKYYKRSLIKPFRCYMGFCSKHPIFHSIIILFLSISIWMSMGFYLKGLWPCFFIFFLFIILNVLVINLFCTLRQHPLPFSCKSYDHLHSFYSRINKGYTYIRSCIVIIFLSSFIYKYFYIFLNLIGYFL